MICAYLTLSGQKFSRVSRLLIVLLAAWQITGGANLSTVQAEPTAEPLPQHPGFTVGELPNGLTYLIKEHAIPANWVAIRLLVTSGSLNEDEDQRGLAHFFEHLAFNGSVHFPAGTLIPTFEDLGVEFGRNLNASTGFDRTLYLVNLPKNDPDTIRTGLLWASDVAFQIGLSGTEIEKERGVILEEYRTGLGAQERIQQKIWSAMMPGARLPDRWPIGLESVIKSADRFTLQRYYDRWYRPDKLTLLIVGDLTAADLLPTITELFNLPARDGGERAADYGAGITPYDAQMAVVITDPEFVGCDVDLTFLDAALPSATTVETFRQQQVLGLAAFVFSHRFESLITGGGMPFRSAQVDVSSAFKSFTFAAAGVSCDAEQWEPALKILAAEVKRMHRFGAVESELARAKSALLAQAKYFAAQEDSLPSPVLASIAISQINSGDTLMSAAQAVELLEALLPTITLAEVNVIYTDYFDPTKMAFSLTLPEQAGLAVPTNEALLATARSALAPAVTAFTESAGATELLTALPEAGVTVAADFDEELAITSVRFTNNLVAHYKRNDFRKNNVLVTISLEGGTIEETVATRGLTEAAVAAWNQSATNTLSSAQIRNLLVDKNISLTVSDRDRDSVQFVLTGLPEALEDGLQLVYLLLTDAVVEESAFTNWQNEKLEELAGRRFDLNAQIIKQLGIARTDDPRLQPLSRANLEGMTSAAVQGWLEQLSRNAPLEVSVVGDIDYDTAMPLIARYLGALNRRPAVASLAARLRNIVVKTGPQERVGYFVSQEDKAFALAAFRGPNATDLREKQLLEVAASILSTRLSKELREERGIVYSIGAVSVPAKVYPELGIFYAASSCASANAPELVEVALQMYEEFAQHGPSPDEVQTALAQIIANLGKTVQEPDFWSDGLSHLVMRGRSLDELRDPVAFFNHAVTPAAVREVFAAYFQPERLITIQVLPQTEAAAAETAEDQ